MPMMFDRLGAAPIEHGTTRLSRWLQARWVSLGATIAVVEGVLILTGQLSKWIAVALALVLLVVYFTSNRSALSPSARLVARIVAFSQVLVLFVPVLVGLLYFGAILALALIAILALAAILRGR